MSEALNLPLEIQSPEDIGKVLLEVRDYLGKLRDRAVRKKVAGVTGETPPELPALTAAVLQANGVTPAKITDIEALAKQLELLRTQAPVAHLTLADTPDDEQRQQFAAWFRRRVHPQALVTFSARGDLGGGVVVRIGATRYDHSFRGRLLENKHKIAEIVARGK